MHGATARLLFSEYVKFLPSAARYGVGPAAAAGTSSAFADSAATRAPSI